MAGSKRRSFPSSAAWAPALALGSTWNTAIPLRQHPTSIHILDNITETYMEISCIWAVMSYEMLWISMNPVDLLPSMLGQATGVTVASNSCDLGLGSRSQDGIQMVSPWIFEEPQGRHLIFSAEQPSLRFLGLCKICKWISPQNMAWNMVLTYLHFRILKWSLIKCSNLKYIKYASRKTRHTDTRL